MLLKPKFGERCNGCGWCCEQEQCLISVEMFGKEPGACRALQYADGRTYCGLVRMASPDLQPSLAFLLGLGMGCDADDPEPPSI